MISLAKNKTPTKEELSKLLSERYERWNHIKEHGSNDPNWADGSNMNLVRNHILYYKKQCEELLLEDDYPEEYHLETPPKFDMNYIAREEEIRERAILTLSEYKRDKNYKYLISVVNSLSQKQKDSTNIDNLIKYVKFMEKSIVQDLLVDMRRQGRSAYMKESFAKCREKIESMNVVEEQKVTEPQQLTLFGM